MNVRQNECSAKGYGHNLLKLHEAAIKLHPQLEFGPLVNPNLKGLHWCHSTVDAFLDRLNKFGHSSNRYHTYGYTVGLDDLMKVDQLIWSVRRHCRLLRYTIDDDGRPVVIDEVERLQHAPQSWSLSNLLAVEAVIDGKRGHDIRAIFLRLNTPFAPDADHRLTKWHMTASNPPLSEYFDWLEAPTAPADAKLVAAEVLRWVLDHIELVKEDKMAVNDALAAYNRSLRASITY